MFCSVRLGRYLIRFKSEFCVKVSRTGESSDFTNGWQHVRCLLYEYQKSFSMPQPPVLGMGGHFHPMWGVPKLSFVLGVRGENYPPKRGERVENC